MSITTLRGSVPDRFRYLTTSVDGFLRRRAPVPPTRRTDTAVVVSLVARSRRHGVFATGELDDGAACPTAAGKHV